MTKTIVYLWYWTNGGGVANLDTEINKNHLGAFDDLERIKWNRKTHGRSGAFLATIVFDDIEMPGARYEPDYNSTLGYVHRWTMSMKIRVGGNRLVKGKKRVRGNGDAKAGKSRM